MRTIYETKGRAREFNELAINLFTGCGHACKYCYGADVTHQTLEKFQRGSVPRVTPDAIARDAKRYYQMGNKRPILFCFVTDPYQPVEAETMLTRNAISILHQFQQRVTILTKGGNRAVRDFDILRPDFDAFATTLTCVGAVDSLVWELGAALPAERIEVLRQAKDRGLETWVSLEPVIFPEQSKELIDLTQKFVDYYKVGTMNYHPHGLTINWKKFAYEIINHLTLWRKSFYIKKDLAKYIGYSEGFWGPR